MPGTRASTDLPRNVRRRTEPDAPGAPASADTRRVPLPQGRDLPPDVVRDIVGRLASQPHGHIRARTMLTVAAIRKEVYDEVRLAPAIIEPRAKSFMAERTIQFHFGSVDRMIESIRQMHDKAREPVTAWHREQAFSDMKPLPARDWRWMLGVPRSGGAPFRGTLQDIEERIQMFGALDGRQRMDVVERMLHIPDAQDRRSAQRLLEAVLEMAGPAEMQQWSRRIEEKRTEILHEEAARLEPLLSGEATYTRERLTAMELVERQFPLLFFRSRNTVFDRFMEGPDDVAKHAGLRALAGHLHALDTVRKERLFDAVVPALSPSGTRPQREALERMALQLGEFSDAKQAEFVQRVMADGDTARQTKMQGLLLGGVDARVPDILREALLSGLEAHPPGTARAAGTAAAIAKGAKGAEGGEGAGFGHLSPPQRERLARMGFADIQAAGGGEARGHLLRALASRFQHLGAGSRGNTIGLLVAGESSQHKAAGIAHVLAQAGARIPQAGEARLVQALLAGQDGPGQVPVVLRSPGFARLSPQHRQDLLHAAGIQDPSPWVPGFPMEGGVNHPREFLKALVHGLSHMDAGALQATVGSLPEATQREIGGAFEFELMMTNVWDRKEHHALLQAGLDVFEDVTPHPAVREGIDATRRRLRALSRLPGDAEDGSGAGVS
ncbi:hypothetical protein M4R23_14380 [Acidovorax sp. GBBC 3332]|nr:MULTISPECIES: hypothetical protein [unclassified Acidovorax]MDA8450855.1 hypothetical protein [Acidovorax sp. GBBC 3297]MDA8460330.1 hypothetical protein [Acidovorax sp. GBBC 3333]MDA8465366.1 hypothetical protein [Acidovorax sp. GBBC 3332]MDA8470400.1 hypothetical protein [Acidovorax sp. GBBC 3299]